LDGFRQKKGDRFISITQEIPQLVVIEYIIAVKPGLLADDKVLESGNDRSLSADIWRIGLAGIRR
jgi:hypothetical protein